MLHLLVGFVFSERTLIYLTRMSSEHLQHLLEIACVKGEAKNLKITYFSNSLILPYTMNPSEFRQSA